MALKQDERALLQLVCERGQSYEDLAGLLGISEDEVRAKARHALSELGGADPDSDVGLTDYLLGQADPIGRADAVRYLQQDPEARELATTIATKLRAIAPGAALPAIPEPRGRRRKAAVDTAAPSGGSAASPAAAGPGTPTAGSERSPGQRRLIAAIAGGGVILVVVILLIAGVFDSGDDSSSGASETTADLSQEDAANLTAEAVAGLSDEQKAALTGLSADEVAGMTDDEIIAAAEQRTITPVKLDTVGGSGVAGVANFKLANDQLFIDLRLDGLDPKIAKDDAYVVWLMINDSLGYPVSQLAPDDNGSVSQQVPVPRPVAAAVGANATSVRVTKSSRTAIEKGIDEAISESQPVLTVTGKRLAEGKIPLAKRRGAGAPDTTTPDTTSGG